MSTLSIHTPRISSESDVDSRFDALVRSAGPARTGVDFETVFDLDYGQLDDRCDDQPSVVLPLPAREPRARAAKVAPRPAPKAVRLTRRGRVVLILAFLGLALALMLPMGDWAAASLTGGTSTPVRVIEVKPGDTLYGIAGEVAKPGHVRDMVARIQELNSLPGGEIAVGQKLAVPRG